MKISAPAGLVAASLALALLGPAPALAAPVTVDLRIEGPTRTLFEGPVTTDVRTFRFTDDPTEHECDGTAANQGPSSTPVPTRGAVLAAASLQTPFATSGTWFSSFGSPSFSAINGESVAFDPATNRFLVEYQNEVQSQTGACGSPVADGDRVLFAYGTGSEELLALSGPATARPGQPVALRVTDAASHAPVAGATVDGRPSAADGTVAVGPFGDRGVHPFKAVKDGAIRSNAVAVCVTDGADGACGTSVPGAPGAPQPARRAPDRTPPGARLLGIREGQAFRRAHAPRTLRVVVPADPSGLAAVKLRLTRRWHGRCWYFSGRREAFRRTRCGRAFFFGVGDQPRVSYLLPGRLGRGRYVLDAVAIDRAGNRDQLRRNRTRVVFTVR